MSGRKPVRLRSPWLALALLLAGLAVGTAAASTSAVPGLHGRLPVAPLTATAPVSDAAGASVPAAPPSSAVDAGSAIQVLLTGPEYWSAGSRASIEAALSMLPVQVRASLGNPLLGPLYISVNTEGRTLTGQQPYGGAANFYSTNEGRNEIVLYPDQGTFTVLHELGHAYNLRHAPAGNYVEVLLEPDMQAFLAASGWRVLTPDRQLRSMIDQTRVDLAYDGAPVWTNLSHNDPLEDFANSFALFFSDPGGLFQLSPARYFWFAQHFN